MKKINIAELLKDCPKGMELDCTMWDNVVFDHIDTTSNYPIYIKKMGGELEYLTEDGHFNFDCDAKCVIFPKGKTTWEGFVPPYKFKDGDILFVKSTYDWLLIYKESENDVDLYKYVATSHNCSYSFITYDCIPICRKKEVSEIRLATEEEKAKLFDAIKANGYKWNPETKTLEKFTPNKFDINTLKAFDKVLVRDNNEQFWTCDWFSFHDTKQVYPFACVGHYVSQCIPYEGNEHLLGTTDDCDEHFKNWE